MILKAVDDRLARRRGRTDWGLRTIGAAGQGYAPLPLEGAHGDHCSAISRTLLRGPSWRGGLVCGERPGGAHSIPSPVVELRARTCLFEFPGAAKVNVLKGVQQPAPSDAGYRAVRAAGVYGLDEAISALFHQRWAIERQ